MTTAYRCPNIGNCEKADRKEVISLPEAVDPACPECGAQLTLAKPPPKPMRSIPIIVASVLLLLLGALSFYGIKSLLGRPAPPALASMAPRVAPTPAATAPRVAPTPAATAPLVAPAPTPTAPVVSPSPATRPVATVILRVHGSNTIGSKLVPSLIDEFLKQQGATGMHIVAGKKVNLRQSALKSSRMAPPQPSPISQATNATSAWLPGRSRPTKQNPVNSPASAICTRPPANMCLALMGSP